MQFLKFILLSSFLISTSFAAYTPKECLESKFNVEVRHKGFPFGLFENILSLKKEGCDLQIMHEKYRFLKKKWMIDVCRAPVHLKEGRGAVSVVKREGSCLKGSKNDFCTTLSSVKKALQDDGLIFAAGEKENLETDHGKVYCLYELTMSYLEEARVLSLAKEVFHKSAPKTSAPTQGWGEAPAVSKPKAADSAKASNDSDVQLEELPKSDSVQF